MSKNTENTTPDLLVSALIEEFGCFVSSSLTRDAKGQFLAELWTGSCNDPNAICVASGTAKSAIAARRAMVADYRMKNGKA